MKPILLHASSKTKKTEKQRVIKKKQYKIELDSYTSDASLKKRKKKQWMCVHFDKRKRVAFLLKTSQALERERERKKVEKKKGRQS